MWWGAGVVISLERGADLHTAQMMPLPLTVCCFSKILIGFTFLVPAHLGSPGQRAVKRVCVCVCVCVCVSPSLVGQSVVVRTFYSSVRWSWSCWTSRGRRCPLRSPHRRGTTVWRSRGVSLTSGRWPWRCCTGRCIGPPRHRLRPHSVRPVSRRQRRWPHNNTPSPPHYWDLRPCIIFSFMHQAGSTLEARASAGFWLGRSMPPCRLRWRKFWKFDYKMVHSDVYLNEYVVSIAPFSTPACPDCSQNIT